MGHTIWVDTQGRPKDSACQDNSIMLQVQDQLDGLSTKLNVPKLSEFYDYSECKEMYGDIDTESDAMEGDWHDPGPALTAVRIIHDHLVQHPEDLGFVAAPSQKHWPTDLMEELRHCRSVLEEAASRGWPFRFLIVP
jgi:hypothetical protein